MYITYVHSLVGCVLHISLFTAVQKCGHKIYTEAKEEVLKQQMNIICDISEIITFIPCIANIAKALTTTIIYVPQSIYVIL